MTQLSSDQYIKLSTEQELTPPGLLPTACTVYHTVSIGTKPTRSWPLLWPTQSFLEVASNARGDLLRRGASAWERLAAKTAGQIICGYGTDVISAALSGDGSLSAAGALTVTDVTVGSDAAGDMLYKSSGTALARLAKGTAGQIMQENGSQLPSWVSASGDASIATGGAVTLANPQRLIQSATVTLTPTTIVGNDAGDLGHADGVELVAAVAGKIIVPESIVLNYTFGVAAYTDGGNVTAGYKDGGAITGIISAASGLGAAADNINLMIPVDGLALVNKALVLRSAAAFTQPGGATGTASVKVNYRLIDA